MFRETNLDAVSLIETIRKQEEEAKSLKSSDSSGKRSSRRLSKKTDEDDEVSALTEIVDFVERHVVESPQASVPIVSGVYVYFIDVINNFPVIYFVLCVNISMFFLVYVYIVHTCHFHYICPSILRTAYPHDLYLCSVCWPHLLDGFSSYVFFLLVIFRELWLITSPLEC